MTIWKYPQWKGLDSAEGLLRVRRHRKLYFETAPPVFPCSNRTRLCKSPNWLKAGDQPAAERTAHTVKGRSCKSLVCKTVRWAAGELEKAIHDGPTARLESLRQQFANRLTRSLTVFVPRWAEEPVSPRRPKPWLLILRN